MKNKAVFVQLNPHFQKELFTILLEKYNGSFNLSKLLERAPSTLRHYKNCRVNGISLKIINKAVKLASIDKEELIRNSVRTYFIDDEIRRCLDEGIKSRRNYLKKHFKIDIKIKDFIKRENGTLYLNIHEWLSKTKWIEKISNQKGIIKEVKATVIKGREIILEYKVYTKANKSFENFVTILPKKIKIDEELLYFIGLRYGDGTNGARIGIANKNLELIKNTAIYLRKLFPTSKIQGAIYLQKKIDKNKLNELELFMKDSVDRFTVYDLQKYKLNGDYVLYVFIINEFFNKIYNQLIKEFRNLFRLLSFKQKGAFLAGFFDAEGNVNKLDKNFRWSQKTKDKVEFIMWLLDNEGYHIRYDGSNIVIAYKEAYRKADLKLFKKQVLPYIHHPDKKKDAIELLNGYYVKDSYKNLVSIIKDNPSIDNEGLFSLIKRKKNHRQLTALVEAGFLNRTRNRVDESFKYSVTEAGINWIKESG